MTFTRKGEATTSFGRLLTESSSHTKILNCSIENPQEQRVRSGPAKVHNPHPHTQPPSDALSRSAVAYLNEKIKKFHFNNYTPKEPTAKQTEKQKFYCNIL